MKVLRIPCFILLLLLTLSLFNCISVSKRCRNWEMSIDTIDNNVVAERWDAASEDLSSLYQDWAQCQTWFHIVIEHKEIDAAESLLQRCRILCQEEDSVEFRSTLVDLRSQVALLDEMQQISIKNIM